MEEAGLEWSRCKASSSGRLGSGAAHCCSGGGSGSPIDFEKLLSKQGSERTVTDLIDEWRGEA